MNESKPLEAAMLSGFFQAMTSFSQCLFKEAHEIDCEISVEFLYLGRYLSNGQKKLANKKYMSHFRGPEQESLEFELIENAWLDYVVGLSSQWAFLKGKGFAPHQIHDVSIPDMYELDYLLTNFFGSQGVSIYKFSRPLKRPYSRVEDELVISSMCAGDYLLSFSLDPDP